MRWEGRKKNSFWRTSLTHLHWKDYYLCHSVSSVRSNDYFCLHLNQVWVSIAFRRISIYLFRNLFIFTISPLADFISLVPIFIFFSSFISFIYFVNATGRYERKSLMRDNFCVECIYLTEPIKNDECRHMRDNN